jgi:hypothetical protein
MASSNVDIRVGSSFDAKGFKQAESAVTKLGKSVRNLGLAFGLAYSTKAVVNFGKSAVKAFTDDQKAAVQLSNTIKNLGLAFADADVQKFIEQLSLASGVVDDQLRPAMQKLLQVTGSVATSQKLLKNAIDISAGSGVDLATVSSDLANAYVGNNKGLKKYALGLTNAELKTASFDKVLTAFNKNFSGASAAYLETYAGKMDKLTTAAGEAQEKIGGALIDAFMNLSGSTGIDDLISKMNTLTDSVVTFIDKIGEGLGILNAIRKSSLFTLSENIQKVQVDAYNRRLKRTNMNAWQGVNIPKTPAQIAAEKKAEDAAAKRARDILAAQNKNTAELKKQAALKKDAGIFDMQQIQLVAALKGKLSDEDRKRVELQLALLNENVTAADSLTKQILMAQDATGNLYKYFMQTPDAKNPFGYLDKWLSDFQTKLNALQFPVAAISSSVYSGGAVVSSTEIIPSNYGIGAGGATLGTAAIPSTNVPFSSGGFTPFDSSSIIPDMAASSSNYGGYSPGQYGQNGTVVVQIDGKTIATANQSQSLSGIPSNVSRVNGMFTG